LIKPKLRNRQRAASPFDWIVIGVTTEQKMLRKTQRQFKRYSRTWKNKDQKHLEIIIEETFWLFFIIPVYKTERIFSSNM